MAASLATDAAISGSTAARDEEEDVAGTDIVVDG